MPPSYRLLSLGAAAWLLASPAANAQPAGLQIYGHLVPSIDHLRVSGARRAPPANPTTMLAAAAYTGNGNGNMTRNQSTVTGIGLRGTEDLGDGLRAFFQLESGFQVGTGALTGPAGTSRFWNRNSAVGLRGGFGSVMFGIWDTPIAWSHLGFTSGVRNPYAGDSSAIFLTPGFNVPHSTTLDTRGNNPADATFNRRQGNSVQYWSPNWSGFSARLFYSHHEGGRVAANGQAIHPTVLGIGTEYAKGPLTLRYVYQQHEDYFGLAWLGPNTAANPDSAGSRANDATDQTHRVIVRYVLTPQWTLQGALDHQRFEVGGVAAGRVDRYSRSAWSAQVVHRQGLHTGWFNLGRADDGNCGVAGGGACSTSGLGASMWSAGYRYDLSRRTDLYASIAQVRNRANGQYGVFARSVAGIAPGSKTDSLTVGIEHSF